MAQTETRKLDGGDGFPELVLSLLDGSALKLPGGIGGNWGVVLFYRGYW